MGDDFTAVVAMIRATGGNPGSVINRARERGIGPIEVEAAVWVAIDKATQD